MDETKPGAARKKWQPPKVIEVGGIVEHTTFGDGNLRDNQGDAKPSYKALTKSKTSDAQVELPPEE